MSIIETAGALRPGLVNTPLDERSRVALLADAADIANPALGGVFYCVETGKHYRITGLKAKTIGALTVADAAVDTYEELHLSASELSAVVVRQVMNNPTLLAFFAYLIENNSGDGSGGGGGVTVPSTPYTYPENVPSSRLTLICPGEEYFAGNPASFDPETWAWSDDDALSVEVYSGDTPVTTSVTAHDGVEIVQQPFFFPVAGTRIGVGIEGGVTGSLTVKYLRGETVVKTETVSFTGYHVPQYFKRPAGIGAWQLKIGGSVVAAEYWDGSDWQDFPAGGLTNAKAGFYIRAKQEPEFPAVACWSNNGADGDPFLYLT